MSTKPGPLDLERIRRARVRLRPHVAHRDFSSESIFLNLEAGFYHGINTVGAEMVERLQASATVAEAAAAIASEYEEPVERVLTDLVALVGALVERDLAEVDYDPPAPAAR